VSAVAEAWNRLFLLRAAATDRLALDRELLLARIAFGDERALDDVPEEERGALLEALVYRARATPTLAKAIDEGSLAQALWAGHARDGDDARAIVARMFAGRQPAPSELDAALARLPLGLRDDGAAAYAERRVFTHEASEYSAVAAIRDPARRLRAMADVAARTRLSPLVAHAWALDADDIAMRLTTEPARLATTLSEVALLCAMAGQREDCTSLLEAALTSLGRITTAAAFAQVFAATLRPAAMLGFERWQAIVEQAHAERALFRDAKAFLEVRIAALRTLPRAIANTPASSTADLGHAIDRGHSLMKEVTRRLPDAALDLFHHTTIIALLATVPGRALDVPLTALRELLRKHPLPPARVDGAAPITLDDIVEPLATRAPEVLIGLSETFTRPEDGARWLLAALPML